jgi:hypothetical protein
LIYRSNENIRGLGPLSRWALYVLLIVELGSEVAVSHHKKFRGGNARIPTPAKYDKGAWKK